MVNGKGRKLLAVLTMAVLLLGIVSLSGCKAKKAENTITVLESQDNSTSVPEYNGNVSHTFSFEGAKDAQGDVTYELVSAKDQDFKDVAYFSIPSPEKTEVLVREATPAGVYTLVIKAKASGDDTHEEGEKEITFFYSIAMARVSYEQEPAARKDLEYTGKPQALVDAGSCLHGKVMYKLDDGEWSEEIPTATDAGIYTVTYKIVGDPNYRDSDERTVVVSIGKKPVDYSNTAYIVTPSVSGMIDYIDKNTGGSEAPAGQKTPVPGVPVENVQVVYDGQLHTNGYTAPEGVAMMGADSGTDCGIYVAIYAPDTNHCWEDGTRTPVTVTLEIIKKPVTMPAVNDVLWFNGEEQKALLTGFDPDLMSVTGDTATEAGVYCAVVSLRDAHNYRWAGSDSADISLEWHIFSNALSVPVVTTVFTYKSTILDIAIPQTVTEDDLDGFNSSLMKIVSGSTATYAGDYELRIALKDPDNYTWGDAEGGSGDRFVTWTINKKSVGDKPADVSVPYTGKSQSNGYDKPYAVHVSGSTKGTDAGDYTATYEPFDNYCWSDGTDGPVTVTLTIEKIASVITEAPEAVTGLEYSGQYQQLITKGKAEGGKLLYKVDSEGQAGNFTSLIPTGKNAGTYTVTYYVEADDNHIDTEKTAVEVTITKAQPSVDSLPSAVRAAYDGQPHELVKAGSSGDGYFVYSTDGINYSTDIPCASDAGEYGICYKFIGDSNHLGFGPEELTSVIFTKKAAEFTAQPEGLTFVYDGQSHPLVSAGTSAEGTVVYRLEDGEWSEEIPSAVCDGEYTVYFKIVGDNNHLDSKESSAVGVITPAEFTVDAPDQYYTYDGQPHGEPVSAVSADGNEPVITYFVGRDFSWDAPQFTDVKSGGLFSKDGYKVEYVIDLTGHETYEGEYYVYIQKADPEVTVVLPELTYTGEDQELVSITAEGGEVSYMTTGPLWVKKVPTGKNTGDYTFFYKVEGDRNHNDIEKTELTNSIGMAKAEITEAPEAVSGLEYNGRYQELVTKGSSDAGKLQYKVSSEGSAGNFTSYIPTGMNAGTYTISYYALGDSNHTESDVYSMEVTISKAAASVDSLPEAVDSDYDGEAHELVSAGSSDHGDFIYSTDGINYSSEIPCATEAGEYTVCYKFVGDRNHLGFGPEELTARIIAKEPAAFTAEPEGLTWTFDGEPHPLASAGTTDEGTVVYRLEDGEWSENIPTAVDVASNDDQAYTVYFKILGDSNHNDSEERSVLGVINNAELIIDAPDQHFTYDGQPHGDPISVTSVDGSEVTVTYRISGSDDPYEETVPTFTDVKSGGLFSDDFYTVKYIAKADNHYYELGSFKVYIDKADPVVTVELPELIYNGEKQELVSITAEGGKVSYMTTGPLWVSSVPTGVKAGEYTFYYKVEGDKNHNDIAKTQLTNTILEEGTAPALEKATFSVMPEAVTVTYDGQPHALAVPGSSDEGTVVYRVDYEDSFYYGEVFPEDFTEDIPYGTYDGTFLIYTKVIGDSAHADSDEYCFESVIEPLPIFVEAPDQYYTYDGQPHGESITVTTPDGYSVNVIYNVGDEYSMYGPQFTDVKSSSLTSKGGYKVEYIAGARGHATATGSYYIYIAKADPEVTVELPELTYTGEDQELVSITAEGGKVSYMTTGPLWVNRVPTGNEPGEYTFYYKVEGDKNHNDIPKTQLTNVITDESGTVPVDPVDPSDPELPKAEFTEEPEALGWVFDGEYHPLVSAGTTDDGTVVYRLEDGEWSEDIPTARDCFLDEETWEEGYKVWYKIVGDSSHSDSEERSVRVVVECAELIIDAPDQHYTYDGQPHGGPVSVTTVDGSEVEVTYRIPGTDDPFEATVPTFTDVKKGGLFSDDFYSVRFIAEAENHYLELGSYNVYIDKADPEVTVELPELTYTGDDQELVRITTEHGKVSYMTTGPLWVSRVPTGNEAGEYTFYYKVEGDSNHNDVEKTLLTNVISDGSGTGPVDPVDPSEPSEPELPKAEFTKHPEGLEYRYDGLEHTLVTVPETDDGTVVFDVLALDWSYEWSEELPKGTEADAYHIRYKIIGDDEHQDSDEYEITGFINLANLEIDAPDQYFTYDGQPHGDPINAVTVDGCEVTYTYKAPGGVYEETVPTFTDVKDSCDLLSSDGYKVQYYALADNHYIGVGSYTVYIEKADPEVTVELPELIYNGEDQQLVSITAEGGKVSYMTTGPLWVSDAPTGRKAGEYTFYYKIEGDSNHNDVEKTKLTNTIYEEGITPGLERASFSVMPEAVTVTYDGQPHALVVPGSSDEGTVVYKVEDKWAWYYGEEYPDEFSEEIPCGTHDGEYRIYTKVIGDSEHSDSEAFSFVSVIEPLPLSVEAPDQYYTYDGQPHGEPVTVTTGDGSEAPVTVTYFLGIEPVWDAPQFTDVKSSGLTSKGGYKVEYVAEAEGYEMVTGEYYIYIEKADPEITVELPELSYTGDDQELVCISADGGRVSYMTTGPLWVSKVPTGNEPGEYTFYYKVTGDKNHNDVEKTALSNTISAIDDVVIDAPDQCYMHTGEPQGRPITAVSPNGKLAVRYGSEEGVYDSGKAPQITEVSESTTVYYEVTLDDQETVHGSYRLEIVKAVPSILDLEAADLVYTGEPQDLVSIADVTGGEILFSTNGKNYSAEIPQATNAGEYKIWYYCKGDANHLDSEPEYLISVIAKADPVVTIELPELSYNGDTQQLVYIFADGQDVSFMTTGPFWVSKAPTGKEPGEYTFYYKVKGDKNHNGIEKTELHNTIAAIDGLTIVAPDQSYPFDIWEHGEPVTAATPEGKLTVRYGSEEGVYTSKEAPQIQYVSESTVVYYQVLKDGEEIATGSYKLEITKAEPWFWVNDPVEDLVYTGEPQVITNGVFSPYAETYYSLDGKHYSTELPQATDAGEYTIWYYLIGDENHLDTEPDTITATMAKADPEVTIELPELTYNGDSQQLVYIFADGQDVSFMTTGPLWVSKAPTGKEPGEYTFYYKVKGDKNHNGIEKTELHNSIAAIDGLTIVAPDQSYPFDIWKHGEPVTAATPEGKLTVRYGSEEGVYTSKNAPQIQYVSESTVVYYQVSKNGEEIATGSYKLEITKSEPWFWVNDPVEDLVYTGEPQVITNGVFSPYAETYYSLDGENYSTELPQATDAGEYTIWYYLIGDENHLDTEPDTITATMAKADPEVTVVLPELTYNGEKQELVSITAEGGKVSFMTTGPFWVSTVPTGKKAGEYTFYYKVTGDSNHNDIPKTQLTNVIGSASGDTGISAPDQSYEYDGKPHGEAVTVSGNATVKYGTAEGEYTLKKAPQISNVNESTTVFYEVTVKGQEPVRGSYALEITKADPSALYEIQVMDGMEYDGDPKNLVLVNVSEPSGVKVFFSRDGENYSTDIPQETEPGEYDVWYYLGGDDNYLETEPVCATASIAGMSPEIQEHPYTVDVQYDGEAHELIIPGSSTDGYFEYSLDGENFSTEAPTATEPGEYEVFIRFIGYGHYLSFDYSGYSYITDLPRARFTEEPEALNYVCDGEPHPLVTAGSTGDGTILYRLEEDTDWSEEIPCAAEEGAYTVCYKIAGDDGHCDSFEDWTVSMIESNELTVIAEPQYFDYDGEPHGDPIEVAGIDGDSAVILYSYDGGEYTEQVPQFTDVKTKFTSLIESIDSYKVDYIARVEGRPEATGTFEIYIWKAEPVVTVELPELTYNGEDQELVSITAEGGKVSYMTTGPLWVSKVPTGKDAGEYVFYYKVTGDSNHFSTQKTQLVNVIAPAESEIPDEPQPADPQEEIPSDPQEETPSGGQSDVPAEDDDDGGCFIWNFFRSRRGSSDGSAHVDGIDIISQTDENGNEVDFFSEDDSVISGSGDMPAGTYTVEAKVTLTVVVDEDGNSYAVIADPSEAVPSETAEPSEEEAEQPSAQEEIQATAENADEVPSSDNDPAEAAPDTAPAADETDSPAETADIQPSETVPSPAFPETGPDDAQDNASAGRGLRALISGLARRFTANPSWRRSFIAFGLPFLI